MLLIFVYFISEKCFSVIYEINSTLNLIDRGVQMSGYMDHQTGKFVHVEEMEPELIVPDLTDFNVS
jgi:hypothetical protein